MSSEVRPRATHAAALLAGAVLYMAFWGLAETSVGLAVTFHPSLTHSSPGELMFWLGHLVLVVPAALLAGYGASPWLAGWLAAAEARLGRLTRRELGAGALALAALYFAAARLGHALVLRGYPVTDDEYAVRFGGQVMALGKLLVEAPQPAAAFPDLYLFFRDGWVTSIDWVGAQAAWALAEATGLGATLFAAAAALAAGCVAWLLQRRLGGAWGAVGFGLFLFSPMAAMLSISTHAHVLSRGAIALALLLYAIAAEGERPGRWLLVGVAAGVGFCCRPVETATLLTPLLADAGLRLLRSGPAGRRAAAALLAGGGIFLGLFALHNLGTTGDPLLQARFAEGAEVSNAIEGTAWHRFGSNAGYSLFLLLIWGLGPLCFTAAFGMRDRFTRLLGLGVVADLAVACFHDFPGIHVVGPIHYSEVAVPLVILAVHGIARLRADLGRARWSFRVPAAMMAMLVTLGLGTFCLHHAGALRRQSFLQARFYQGIEAAVAAAGAQRALVLAPQFGRSWAATPLANVGTWVFEWRRARPDLSDPILILHDRPELLPELRRRFPDRTFFRFRPLAVSPFFQVTALEPGAGGP